MGKNNFIISNCVGSIIDIGSNNGSVFPDFMRDRITSVDRDLYDIPNFVRANAEKLPFKNQEFDTAVLAEILEHVDNPVKVIREALRVSRRVIITVPNDALWDKDRYPFEDIDKTIARTGKTREELAKLGNPDVKDFDKSDNLGHLWHVRWYSRETLDIDLKKAGVKSYYITDLSECGVHWFGILIDNI